jgi:hypothetical protein
LSNSGTTQADRGAPSPAEGLFGYHRDYQDDTTKEVNESIVGEGTDALSSSDSVVSNSNTEDPICITSRSTTHSSVCDGLKSELIGCPEENGAVSSSYESDGFPFEGDADNNKLHSSVSISTCGSYSSENCDDHGKDDSPTCTRVDEDNESRSSLRCTDQDIDKTEAKTIDGDLHASSAECGTTASTTCPPGTADASGVEVPPCYLGSEVKDKVKESLNSSVVNGKLLIACDQLSRLVSPFALTITALSLMHALTFSRHIPIGRIECW